MSQVYDSELVTPVCMTLKNVVTKDLAKAICAMYLIYVTVVHLKMMHLSLAGLNGIWGLSLLL
jgi:hypothetical protein